MGLIGDFFNFQPSLRDAGRTFGTDKDRDTQKVREDTEKIESQIEFTNGLLQNSETQSTSFRRPLFG